MLALRLGKPEDVGILASLVHDHKPDVRATAASALASLIDTPSGSSTVAACLRQCLRDTGTLVPISIAVTLAQPGHTGSEAREVLAHLATHRSARARRAAQTADSGD
jgi:HEAT repeat protein